MKIIQSDIINLLLLEYDKDNTLEALNLNNLNHVRQEKEFVHLVFINNEWVTWTCDSVADAKYTYNNVVEFLTQSGRYSSDDKSNEEDSRSEMAPNSENHPVISKSFDI